MCWSEGGRGRRGAAVDVVAGGAEAGGGCGGGAAPGERGAEAAAAEAVVEVDRGAGGAECGVDPPPLLGTRPAGRV